MKIRNYLYIAILMGASYAGYAHGLYVGSLGGKQDVAGFDNLIGKLADNHQKIFMSDGYIDMPQKGLK